MGILLNSQLQTNSETRHKRRDQSCGEKLLLTFGFGRKKETGSGKRKTLEQQKALEYSEQISEAEREAKRVTDPQRGNR